MTRHGRDLLNDPIRNRGTAFTTLEREALGLGGLLPPAVETLERQVARVIEQITRKPSPLEAYTFLMALPDQNETLFYRAVLDHLEAAMPIIYTPTVGEAAPCVCKSCCDATASYGSRSDEARPSRYQSAAVRHQFPTFAFDGGDMFLGDISYPLKRITG